MRIRRSMAALVAVPLLAGGAYHVRSAPSPVVRNVGRTKPSRMIIVDDRMVPPEQERESDRRANATTVTLGSGHVPMLSQPARVAAVIPDAASKSGDRARPASARGR